MVEDSNLTAWIKALNKNGLPFFTNVKTEEQTTNNTQNI